MKLVGRCPCGVREDLAAQDRDAHHRCRGNERCSKCRIVKPLSRFRRLYNLGGGYCKACRNSTARRRYATTPEARTKILRRHSAWYARHSAREQQKHQTWYAQNRERERAKQAVRDRGHRERAA